MEVLNKKLRWKSILKWGLINSILIGLISFIIYKSVKLKIESKSQDLIMQINRQNDTFNNLALYHKNKDSVLLDYINNDSIKMSHENLQYLKSQYDALIISKDSIKIINEIINSVEKLKSSLVQLPTANPVTNTTKKIDCPELRRLRMDISSKINGTKGIGGIYREMQGFIADISKRKNMNTKEDTSRLNFINDHILKLIAWKR